MSESENRGISRRSFVAGSGIALAGLTVGAAALAPALSGCSAGSQASDGGYRPGTYEAAAPGRNGEVVVEVTFGADAIEGVSVARHEETAAISGSAIKRIPACILDGQTLNVDSVAGATLTSGAILSAVAECVERAGGDAGALKKRDPAPSSTALSPGTYTAVAHGHHSDVEVEVSFGAASIDSVKVLSSGETFNLADAAISAVPAAIVEKQTVGVDAVSGATFTSCAIRTAVEECLEQAGGPEVVRGFGFRADSDPWPSGEAIVDADVVVVGSGMAGIAAALSAQENGAETVIVEKLPFWGGVSQTVRGYFAIAADDSEQAVRDYVEYGMNAECGVMKGDVSFDGYPDEELLRTLAENSWRATKWLEGQGASLEWSTEPYVYGAQPQYYRMDAHFADSEVQEPNVVGTNFKALIERFEENGGRVYLDAPMTEILVEGGSVVGIKASGKGGSYVFNAKKGVILCTGGFGASEEMVKRYAPAYKGEECVTLSGNTGEGIKLAEDIGAAVYDNAYLSAQNGHTIVDDHAMIHPYQDHLTPMSSIYVNNQGLRVNGEDPIKYSPGSCYVYPEEKDFYWAIVNEKVASLETNIKILGEDLSSDSRYIDILEEQLESGNERFHSAESLAELANAIGVMPNVLRYTVNRYNGFCTAGVDEDFAKPSQYLVAMEEGPWYAVKCVMKYFCTIGGLKITKEAAVLSCDGTPIEGLFAAGESSNHGFFNLFYAGARSMTVGLVMGKIAGESAAAR